MQKANLIVVLVIEMLMATLCQAGGLEYKIYSGEKQLGASQIQTKMIQIEGHIEITTHIKTKLRAKAFFITLFSMDTEESYVLDDLGLQYYRSKGDMDGTEFTVSVQRDSVGLQLNATSEGETLTQHYPQTKYDFTSYEEPGDRLNVLGQTISFRVFELDDFQIVETKYTWLHDETITVAGTEVVCHLMEISTEDTQCRRWLAKDSYNTLIKEEGKDPDGAYRLELSIYPAELEQGCGQ